MMKTQSGLDYVTEDSLFLLSRFAASILSSNISFKMNMWFG